MAFAAPLLSTGHQGVSLIAPPAFASQNQRAFTSKVPTKNDEDPSTTSDGDGEHSSGSISAGENSNVSKRSPKTDALLKWVEKRKDIPGKEKEECRRLIKEDGLEFGKPPFDTTEDCKNFFELAFGENTALTKHLGSLAYGESKKHMESGGKRVRTFPPLGEFNGRKLLKNLPFFTNRIADLSHMLLSIHRNANAYTDDTRKETMYSALSWGTGKTTLGLQCLKQFYVQEDVLLRGVDDEWHKLERGKNIYLSHVDLRKVTKVKTYGTEELTTSILVAGLLHSVKIASKSDAFTSRPYTPVLSSSTAAKFEDWWEENQSSCVEYPDKIVEKFWELLGLDEDTAPTVLIHIDEMGHYSAFSSSNSRNIDRLQHFWSKLHHSTRIQYYICSRAEDLSRIKEHSGEDISPAHMIPLWLGTLGDDDIAVILKERFKSSSLDDDDLKEKARLLRAYTSGVPRFVTESVMDAGKLNRITQEQIIKSTEVVVQSHLQRVKKLKKAGEYMRLMYGLSMWQFELAMDKKVGEVIESIRPLIANEDWCTNSTYNSLRMIDLVRLLGGYVDPIGPQQKSMVITFPRILIRHPDFQEAFTVREYLKDWLEWIPRTSPEFFEFLVPVAVKIRLELLHSTANYVIKWEDVLPGLEGSVMAKGNAHIEGMHPIPAITTNEDEEEQALANEENYRKFVQIISQTKSATNVGGSGMTVRRADWPIILDNLAYGHFYLRDAENKSSGEDGVFIGGTPLSVRNRRRLHVIGWQEKRYKDSTTLGNEMLIHEAKKTLVPALTNDDGVFVSLVIFTTTSNVSFTHTIPPVENDSKRILVKGGTFLRHTYQQSEKKPLEFTVPENCEIIVIKREGAASILPGLSRKEDTSALAPDNVGLIKKGDRDLWNETPASSIAKISNKKLGKGDLFRLAVREKILEDTTTNFNKYKKEQLVDLIKEKFASEETTDDDDD